MRKGWLRLLTFIPLLGVLFGINYYEDPGNVFHEASQEIADAMLAGQNVYLGSSNCNDRMLVTSLIEGMPKHVDCLTIGPSLTMGIRRGNVGTDSYYNLSMSNLCFTDMMAEFGLLELNGVEYDRVILCLDVFMFDPELNAEYTSPEMEPYATYMLGKLEGREMAYPNAYVNYERFKDQVREIMSVSYFQSCVWFIRSNESLKIPTDRWGIVDESTQDMAYYMSDGSYVYSAGYRANDEEYVTNQAKFFEYDVVAPDRHIDPTYAQQIRLLMDYLTARGVEVDFYISPFCPTIWELIQLQGEHCPIVGEIEQYLNELAEEYGFGVIGSYNPYVVGVTEADYWDSRHLSHDRMNELFDFT
ncbi:MAG: hypothetical protein IJ757_01700 [Clostridiales bacterium]|nr:hypothetical protein [Clostridiales bacterium]